MDEENREITQKDTSDMDQFRQSIALRREQRENLVGNLRQELNKLRDENLILRQIISSAGLECPNHSMSMDMVTENNENVENRTIEQFNKIDDNVDNDVVDDNGGGGSGGEKIDILENKEVNIKVQLADVQLALQLANAEILSLTTELSAMKRQVGSLKEVIVISKQMIEIRDQQVTQLSAKLKDIEESLADRELKLMSDSLKMEYMKQLDNIRGLKILYEQRARAAAVENENLTRRLATKTIQLEEEIAKNKDYQDQIASLEIEVTETMTELKETKEELSQAKLENDDLQVDLSAINQLFTQILTGFNFGNNLDIDKLTEILEENRILLNEMTNNDESIKSDSFLPKLLCDLVTQAGQTGVDGGDGGSGDDDNNNDGNENGEVPVDESDDSGGVDGDGGGGGGSGDSEKNNKINSTEDIISNLPKVWRVLTELLSHHKKLDPLPPVKTSVPGETGDCYKSVETPTGPQLVLSVSKTFIKLKDLILEKKSLQKETNRLKTLNNHLERRLQNQEKRLGAVSVELTKTWYLVGRMQRQHRQLHTNEQVLRYQLQQKRRMLNGLKDELEYCRRKWAMAKEKNDDSEIQCKSLRLEFAKRKKQDANNSAESGYSDDQITDEDDDQVPKEIDLNSFGQRTNSRSPVPLDVNQPTMSENINRVNVESSSPVHDSEPPLTENPISECEAETSSSSSQNQDESLLTDTEVDYTTRRTERIRRLEEQCQQLKLRIKETTNRGHIMSEQLDEVHNRIGGSGRSSMERERSVEAKAAAKINKLDPVKNEENIAVNPEPEPPAPVQTKEETLEEMFYRITGEINPNKIATPVVSNLPEPCCSNSLSCVEEGKESEFILTHSEVDAVSPEFESIQNIENDLLDDVQSSHSVDSDEQTEQCKSEVNEIRLSEEKDKENIGQTSTSHTDSHQLPSTSSDKPDEHFLTQAEIEYTERRAERIRRLEEQCQELKFRIRTTTNRGQDMSEQLDDVHNRYGNERESEEPETDGNEPDSESSSIQEDLKKKRN